MNVLDHLPVVAKLKIKNSSVNVENRTIDIKPNGTSVVIESIRILLAEILVSSRMTREQNLNSCVH